MSKVKKRTRARRVSASRSLRGTHTVVVSIVSTFMNTFDLYLETATGRRSMAYGRQLPECFEKLEEKLKALRNVPETWLEPDLHPVKALGDRISE